MVAVAISVSSCAMPTPMVMPRAETLTGQAAFPEFFVLRARVSVRQDEKLDSFSLEWTRSAQDGIQHDVIRVLTPFGSQLAQLTITPTLAILQRGSERIEAERVGTLTENLLGVAITPAQLLGWLQQSVAGTVEGWHISSGRFTQFGAIRLATRVDAERTERTQRTEATEHTERMQQLVRVVLDDFIAH